MGFSLQLAHDLIEVEAGGNAPVSILVTNRGDSSDRFELEIEGLDSEWKAIPVPTFLVDVGETHSERAFLKPPRVSESIAGNYPFVVRVRSLDSGEHKIVQGVLKLKPFHHLTIEVDPKKGLYSWSTHRNVFEIKLANLGNADHNLQLSGGDPEDACTYEFESELIALKPGQQKEITVRVTPVTSPLFAGSKLIGFSVQARSVDVPSVAAAGQAQLERRSLLNPANLAFILLAIILIGAWLVMKPKPPRVDLAPSAMEGLPGDKITISWEAHDADHLILYSVDSSNTKTNIYDGGATSSGVPLYLGTPGNESIFAEVSKGSMRSLPELKTVIRVDQPAKKITPLITDFHGSSHRVKIPGDIVFSWKVSDAIKVALPPDYDDLPPELESQTVHFTSAGEKDYNLVAFSKDGVSTRSKSWHVVAVDVSDASISHFTAMPNPIVPGGSVTISWDVVNASDIALSYSGTTMDALPKSGTQQITVNANTEFVLTATDSQNRVTTKKLVVKLLPVVPTNPQPGSGPADGSASTTGTTPPGPGGTPVGPTGGGPADGTTNSGPLRPR